MARKYPQKYPRYVTLRLSQEQLDALRKQARDEDRPLGNFLRQVVVRAVEKEPEASRVG